jgi:DNA polymerase III sliding clamp (beta) subunit (PCNA family)
MAVDLDILSWLEEEESVVPAIEVRSTHSNSLTATEVSGTCFEIQREVLLSLIEKAISVVPTRDMVPVFTNFQFHVSEDELKIVATSETVSMVVSTTQINTKVAGVDVLPARTLLTIIKETNVGSTVFIEVTASGAVIVSGSFSAEIAMASGRDFPKMNSLDAVVFHEIDRQKFLNAITAVKYALPGKDFSGQASMKVINIKGGKFTACDGSRFQQTRIDGFSLSMQLPSDSIPVLTKVLASTDIETLEIGEIAGIPGKLIFKVGTTILYCNKLTNVYPNVEQLWLRPALSNDQELLVDRQELITAIKQVRFALDSVTSAIGMVIGNNEMRITAKGENNSANDVISCKWAGKPRTIVVNCYHLAEMLKAHPQQECRFMLGEDTKLYKSPILLKDDDTLAIATISQLLSYRAGLTD